MALKEGINARLLEVEFPGLRQKKTRKRKVNREYAVCFAALCPKSTAMVMAGRSVHLTTLFPGQA